MTGNSAGNEAGKDSLFIQEVAGHQALYKRIIQLFHSSTKAAAFMLIAAIAALVIANTAFYDQFYAFWHTEVGFFFGEAKAEMSLAHVINDIFMAVFFLLVGLEIKYEMTVGELTNIRQALLPIVAAFGGVFFPIIIYLIFNATNPETAHGWGVPTATDIAFALGIMALLGNRVPNGIRVFLSTLAVADDIIAILVIAIFYGQSPSAFWLAAAAVVFVALIVMNRRHVYSLTPYILVGIVLWYCVFMSGVHSTIAGVLLAFAIPSGSRVNLKSFISWSGNRIKEAKELYEPNDPVIGQKDYIETVSRLSRVARQVVPPATRLENKLYPWVYFAILPLFALTNADVSFVDGSLGNIFADPALYGVFFGLLIGKPVGIMLFSFIIVKTKLASLPEHANWGHMFGAGILGGVGFTMAIFVANLAFDDPAIVTTAKLAILSASLIAGVVGFLVLFIQANAARKKGVAYIATAPDGAAHPASDKEYMEAGKRMLEEIESPLLKEEIEAAQREGDGYAEIVVELGIDGERSDRAAAEGSDDPDRLDGAGPDERKRD
ncbi:Na+/H+ antiporter NhaA [Raoultibacter massiliensis]|uniref:Na(+)/H(+) antiporter NhaA n=1 Tax=Raoultibacter massiliensis TaxID=1852371 RepID=A0ABV1J9Z1_9ACTN|nr:Na+/H+ antiporter NhaA [Raoultibacter massiliensis]